MSYKPGYEKETTDVATIRKILNEPENCKYANQLIATENEIMRRCNTSSGNDASVKDPRAVIREMIANGELRVNPDFVALQQNHPDFECTLTASASALGEHCKNAGLPINIHTLERAFEQIEVNFIPHSQFWHDKQVQQQNQLEANRLRGEFFESYKRSFEYRLVGQHWVKVNEKLLTHTPALYEKERARLAGLPLAQLRAEAAAKTEATARAEAESEEKQRLAQLSRADLVEIANQGRQKFQQFESIPATYSPPGKPEVSIPWSPLLIKKLPSTEILKISRRFGWDQINAAIQNAAKGK